jgi:hypothetical protein
MKTQLGRRLFLFSSAMAVFLLGSQTAFAVRLVKFEISIDNKEVLVASTGDQGEEPDVVWNYLKKLPLRPAEKSTFVIRPDADNDAQATLKGEIRIRCYYGGGEATVKELKLVRDKKDKAKWLIDPAEVDRTFKLRKKPKGTR